MVLRRPRVTVMAGSCTVVLPPDGTYVRKITYPTPGGPEGLAGGFWSIIGMAFSDFCCAAVTVGSSRTVNATCLAFWLQRHGLSDPGLAVIW